MASVEQNRKARKEGLRVKPSEYCNARLRKQPGRLCKNRAGFRTPHAGQGRCYLHGGLKPITHGRYSALNNTRINELIHQYENDPDPLNMLSELAAARAMFVDWVERFETFRDGLLAWHASFNPEYRKAVSEAKKNEQPLPHPAEYVEKPRQVIDIAAGQGLLAEITRIVTRIEKIHSENAVSRPELLRIMQEMGRALDHYVKDEKLKAKIGEAWLQIRLAPTPKT